MPNSSTSVVWIAVRVRPGLDMYLSLGRSSRLGQGRSPYLVTVKFKFNVMVVGQGVWFGIQVHIQFWVLVQVIFRYGLRPDLGAGPWLRPKCIMHEAFSAPAEHFVSNVHNFEDRSCCQLLINVATSQHPVILTFCAHTVGHQEDGVLMYWIQNGLVDIPTTAYLGPVPIWNKVRNDISADSVQYMLIQSDRLSSAIRLWNTVPVDICQLSLDSFNTHLSSFRFIWAPD